MVTGALLILMAAVNWYGTWKVMGIGTVTVSLYSIGVVTLSL